MVKLEGQSGAGLVGLFAKKGRRRMELLNPSGKRRIQKDKKNIVV